MAETAQFANAANAFISGFSQSRQLIRQREQSERQQEQFELQQDVRREELRALREESRNREIRRSGKALMNALENDVTPPPELVKNFSDAAGLTPEQLVDPQTREDAEFLEQAAQAPDQVDQDRLIDATNNVFRRQLQRGKGETIEMDGKEFTIKDKRVEGITVGSTDEGEGDPRRVMFDLAVTAEGPDGETRTFSAPMTENRSVEDEFVMEVPVEDLANRVKGTQLVTRGIQSNPEIRERIESSVIRAGGEFPDPEFGIETFQVGDREVTMETKDGRPFRVIARGDEEKNTEIIEREVDGEQRKQLIDQDTGELVRDLGPAGEASESTDIVELQEGEETRKFLVDTESGERIADLGQAPVDDDGNGGFDPASDFGSSDSNQIREVVEDDLADAFSDNGVPIPTSEERRQLITLAGSIGDRLFINSRTSEDSENLSHGEAGQLALQQVAQARREAAENVEASAEQSRTTEEGAFGVTSETTGGPTEQERRRAVQRRTREVLQEKGLLQGGTGQGIGVRSRGNNQAAGTGGQRAQGTSGDQASSGGQGTSRGQSGSASQPSASDQQSRSSQSQQQPSATAGTAQRRQSTGQQRRSGQGGGQRRGERQATPGSQQRAQSVTREADLNEEQRAALRAARERLQGPDDVAKNPDDVKRALVERAGVPEDIAERLVRPFRQRDG